MLEVTDLSKSFGPRSLWRNVTFRTPSGTLTALTGPSGAGKSTLLHCIGRLQQPDQGKIVYDSMDLLSLSTSGVRRFRKEIFGYLFQNYALIEDATVLDNLKLAVPRGTPRDRLASALERVGLRDKLSVKVFTLSGGEQQRVAFARIIARDAKLVLADEPTGALDDENAAAVVEHLRVLAQRGATVVVATHNPVVWEACDQVIQLNGAQLPSDTGPAASNDAPTRSTREVSEPEPSTPKRARSRDS